LIILLKYQRSPRFIKPIAHSFAHPSIQCGAIEPNDPALAAERDLAATHAVVQRVTAHAEIPRGGVHIEVARFDCRTLFNDLRFHGVLLTSEKLSAGAARVPDVRDRSARSEPPSVQRLGMTARVRDIEQPEISAHVDTGRAGRYVAV
jgi:hypothetical protein